MYIELKNVCKTIKGVTILDDISLRFDGGKVYGVEGKNGCGKTMLMRAICGLIRLSSGTININGKILGKDMSFPESIGVLIENPTFLDEYTGMKNLQLIAGIKGNISNDEICKAISGVGLEPYDKRKYKKYSLGMKQKLGIAAAIMESPEIVILDEPINAIDENGVEKVRDIMKKCRDSGAVTIIACHDRDELELLADKIYTISQGKIIGNRKIDDFH